MANRLTDIFRRSKAKNKIEEKAEPRHTEDNNIIIGGLSTSNLTLLEGTDVANTDEEKLIALYRQMENDAVISAALDLYADSATQPNLKTGHVVAIESPNKTFENEINEFLHDHIKIDTEAWQIVRDVARDGKILLDTQVDSSDWSFVPIQDPSKVKVLTLGQDKIKYFVVSPEEKKDTSNNSPFSFLSGDSNKLNEYTVESKDRFIAGFTSRENKGTMTIISDSKYTPDGEQVREELSIRSGRSVLASIVQTYQTLSALEDAMFINRLTKSTEFKVVQIDVGEGTDNKQAKQIIDAVKNAFKSSESIDTSINRYANRQSPIPINDFVYVPTRGTKGTVTIETVGGELKEVQTGDIDYYRNKLFAGLGVLKAYLGFEETTPGGLGDSTLTKLDERFGRRVIRLQSVLSHIVKQMVEFYWRYSAASITRTVDNMPKYKLVLGKISTKEEDENTKRLETNLSIASSIVGMLKDEDFVNFVDKEKLFKYIFEDIIGLDTSMFSREPIPEELSLKVHELKESIGKLKTENNTDFITEDLRDILSAVKETDVKQIFEEYDIFLDTGENIIPFSVGFNISRYNKALLLEATYKQLKDLSKSKDPERLKKSKKLTAKYTGLDDDLNITFEITAEDPEDNKAKGRPTSYTTKVALKDLTSIIKASREEDTVPRDKDLVMAAIQGDIDVSCECPAAKYWGQQYNGTKDNYSLDKNDIPPTVRIPTQPICKHTVLTLTVLPFWYNTIIRDLRNKGVLPSSEVKNKKVDKKQTEVEADDIENLEDIDKEK